MKNKQMCFEPGFKCDYCRSSPDLFWKLVPVAAAGIIAKSRISMLRVNPWCF